MAQWVKHLTLDFSSGHDLRVLRSSPMLGSALPGSRLEILSPPAPPPSLKKKKNQQEEMMTGLETELNRITLKGL